MKYFLGRSVFLALSKITLYFLYEEPPPPHVDSNTTFNGNFDITEILINKVPDYKGKIRWVCVEFHSVTVRNSICISLLLVRVCKVQSRIEASVHRRSVHCVRKNCFIKNIFSKCNYFRSFQRFLCVNRVLILEMF